MRKLIILFFLYFSAVSTKGQVESIYADLLSKYVSSEGNVNYKGFISEKENFQKYLDYLSETRPSDNSSENEKMAYWINAYNAFTIKLIVDNYPVKSIKDLNPLFSIPGIYTVWHREFFQIGDEDFNLDCIEHDILRSEFSDARIHFALNCASKSCPNLLNEPYKADILNHQLSDQTKKFLSDSKRNNIRKDQVQLSMIFNWFRNDFEKEGGLIKFISAYTDIVISKEAKISFLPYDWNLNE